MRGDAEPAEPADVLDDVARLAAERIRRGRHVERDVVAAVGADLDAVEAQDAGAIGRRIGRARAVAVIGEDDELQAGAGGRRGDLVGRAPAVGSVGVDVERAGNVPSPRACRRRAAARRRGGSVTPTKTATAATRAAVARRSFFTDSDVRVSAFSDRHGPAKPACRTVPDCGRGLVGALPGELRLGAAEVAERRGLLVDRPAQVELLHDAARRQLEVLRGPAP